MAKLTTKGRKAVPKSDFALPGKRSKSGGKGGYPVEDGAHARNALSRVSANGTPAQKAEVRAKVHAKFPDIGAGAKKKSGERERGRRTDGRGREGRN
ncbi:MAG: hypothetical protein ACP5IL_12890 [Syntrophobacteraceae bacterium]